MIVPVSAASFFDALRMGSEIFVSLKAILSKKGLGTECRRRRRGGSTAKMQSRSTGAFNAGH